ncbi:MAG: RluA family pseudouridine synthase [Nitrospinota bacterium]
MSNDYKLNLLIVDDNNANARIDQFLATKITDLSRAEIKRTIERGDVECDGCRSTKPSFRLKAGSQVSIKCKTIVANEPIAAEDIKLDILYEDDDLAVINKPPFMITHPTQSVRSATLVNGLIWHYKDNLSKVAGQDRPGIVHRLDKDSSGLILIAKNDLAHNLLAKQLSTRVLKRTYIAVAKGSDIKDNKTINAPIGRSKRNRLKMTIDHENGKDAITEVEVIERLVRCVVLKVRIKTGRTHQIRVHLHSIGYPIIGDALYISKHSKFPINRQALHAYEVSFEHPTKKVNMKFKQPLPADITTLISKLGGDLSKIG